MSSSKVLLDEKSARTPPPLVGSPAQAWKVVGWFGLLLAAIGLSDIALAFYPPHFGILEWEFGTVASSFAGLPIVTLGFAGLLASAIARARRRQILAIAVILLLLVVLVAAAYFIFLTDVPAALRAVQGDVRLGIKKATVKTTFLGVGFGGAYLVAAIGALRFLRPKKPTM